MRLELIDVTSETRQAFLDYVAEHGAEHDETFTRPDDLLAFDPTHEPAALALAPDGAVVGAASVIRAGYVEKSSARFRVLHAIDYIAYPLLIERVLSRMSARTKRVFVFLPDGEGHVQRAVATAGFSVTRQAYLLEHSDPGAVERVDPPEGFTVGPATPMAAGMWAEVVNATFAEYPCRHVMSVEEARVALPRPGVVPLGTLIAHKNGTPAGVVLTVAHPDERGTARIDTLAVVPAEQGKGLGKMLLHAALRAAADAGNRRVLLTTVPSAEPSLGLYAESGFHIAQARICWEADRTR
jgi:ribosomal protein S18 acetylase RimI-like enzyme